jgi:hypothetical protein
MPFDIAELSRIGQLLQEKDSHTAVHVRDYFLCDEDFLEHFVSEEASQAKQL